MKNIIVFFTLSDTIFNFISISYLLLEKNQKSIDYKRPQNLKFNQNKK